MIYKFLMGIVPLILICALAFAEESRTIAVPNFNNNSIVARDQMEPLASGLSEMLNTELSQIAYFKVVERQKLQALIEEMSLGQTGLVDEGSAQKVGKLLGAQTMLLGGFIHQFGDKMRIDVRIVEVETGITLKAVEQTGKSDKLFDMVKEISKEISKFYKVKLSGEDKNRLKKNSGAEDIKLSLAYSRGIESYDAGNKQLKAGDVAAAKQHFGEALEHFRKASAGKDSFSDAANKITEINEILKSI